MAGNYGQFIDRSPIICAAGKPSGDPTQTLSACLKNYPMVDEIDALKHDAGIFEEHRQPFIYELPKLINLRHRGVLTESRPLLQPPVKTRYQALINDLKETSYDSYWNKLQGRTRDPIPGLPVGMDTIQTTYGKPTDKSLTVREIVNPPITEYQVLWDSQVGHEMYKKTHNDYNPAEQRDRGYCAPPFDSDKRYGQRTAYDPRGIWVRCACHWHNDKPITTVNCIQSEAIKRKRGRIGEVFAPNDNISCVPKEHMFGKPSNRALYGAADLLKDPEYEPCIFKRDFHQWISLLNKLRIFIKKRFNMFDFSLKAFRDHVMYYDKEHTGWVPLKLFYKLCHCYDLHYQYECLEPLFNFIGVIENDQINYRDFVFLVDINTSVPEIIKIEDIPEGSKYYVTSAQAASCDYLQMDNSSMPKAGLPAIRYDLPHLSKPEGGCGADIENLGDETTAGGLVNPSIYTNYDLSYRDFFMPRSPAMIKKVFENIGYEFPNDTFERLWEVGLKRDKTGSVCVDTFKQLMKETVPPPKLIIKTTDKCS